MKPKDIFSLAVRLLGLVFLYHGLRDLPPAIGQIIGAFPRDVGPQTIPMSFGDFATGVAMVAWPLLVAYWLLQGAPFIMRIAYPDAKASAKDETPIGGVLGHTLNA